MRFHRSAFVVALGLCLSGGLHAQTAPATVWSVANPVPYPHPYFYPVQGVAWSPVLARVTFGSADRWIRTRASSSGSLLFATRQQPDRIGGIEHLVYSTDGAFVGTYNANRHGLYRVQNASDGTVLGSMLIAIDPSERVRFEPDATLTTNTGDTSAERWNASQLVVTRIVGVGYDKITTNWVFSPNNALQASASQGTITIQRRSDGGIVALITGGNRKGLTPMAFSPDSTRLAAWSRWPNETTLYRVSDGAVVMRFPNGNRFDTVAAVRFSPGGTRLVTTGDQPVTAPDGSIDRRGVIRFWRVSDGALRHVFNGGTDSGVTSPVAWSPGFTRFAYGTKEGAAVVAQVPSP
jgi:WD40 repeat protein